jgi:3-dehydroquinate dehydratase I
MARIPRSGMVGVIASKEELRIARSIHTPPDFFELRLDRLLSLQKSDIAKLKSPLIITARHPAEGGAAKLSRMERRDLLSKFLPHAALVDVELRSLSALYEIWQEAGRKKVGRICSFHNFHRTPALARLREQRKRAADAGADIFKIVTRADAIDDLITLLRVLRLQSNAARLCVMATGKFGAISRLLFPECGSVLVYAPLNRAFHDGQVTLERLRGLRHF